MLKGGEETELEKYLVIVLSALLVLAKVKVIVFGVPLGPVHTCNGLHTK